MHPVERSLFINAPPATVFRAYTDLSRWLEWNPHLRKVKFNGQGTLALGSKVSTGVKASPVSTTWKVTDLEADRSLTWKSSFPPGVGVVFDHLAEKEWGGTRATLRLTITGPLALVAWAGWVPLFVTGLPGPMDIMNQNEPGLFYGHNLQRSLYQLKSLIEA